MSYIGSTPTTQSFIEGTDYFNGDGSTTAFTLSRSVVSPNDIMAVVNNVVQQPNSAYTISGTTITFTSAPSAGTSNVYVRYMSTTTQSITPSQNTVSYNTWNSDLQNKTWGYKNKFINGSMAIDQRNSGASVSTTSTSTGTYTVDRWDYYASSSSKFTVQQNAGSVTPPAGFTYYLGCTSSAATALGGTDYYLISQKIEGYNCADLAWGSNNAKTVTLSFWVYSSLTGTFGGCLRNGVQNYYYPFSYTISSANTWQQISVTIVGPTSSSFSAGNSVTNGIGLEVIFSLGTGSTYSLAAGSWTSSISLSASGATSVVGVSGATWYMTGAQIEIGTQATNFDVREYGTELRMCQRYFEVITVGPNGGAGTNYSGGIANMLTNSTTQVYGTINFKVTKRSSATLVVANGSNYYQAYIAGNSGFNFTTISQDHYGTQQSSIVSTVNSGTFTSGYCGYFYANSANAFLAFSAEL